MNTKNNTVSLNSKSTIRAWDIEYINHVKDFWKPFNNSIAVVFSDWEYNFWIRWLDLAGMEQGVEKMRNIKYDYYEDSNWIHHYVVNLPNGRVLNFSWETIDEAREKYNRYDLHDIWRAPDGTSWYFSKFLHDALLWNFHWCYLEKLEPIKGIHNSVFNLNTKKRWHKHFKKGRWFV